MHVRNDRNQLAIFRKSADRTVHNVTRGVRRDFEILLKTAGGEDTLEAYEPDEA